MTAVVGSLPPGTEARLRWDFENMDIRSKAVERQLQPLVNQVTTLVNSKSEPSQRRKRGKSEKAAVLVASVEKAIEHFVAKGELMVRANPDAQPQLGNALDDVTRTGKDMILNAREFAAAPCESARRTKMVDAARALLSAVTRLLCLADFLDVQLLLKTLAKVRGELAGVKEASSQEQVEERMGALNRQMDQLSRESGRRAGDLRDAIERDDMQAARALLKTNNPVLYTSSKAFVRHPEIDPARLNRDYAFGQMATALDAIEDVLAGERPKAGDIALSHSQVGALLADLERFSNRVYLDTKTYDKDAARRELEEELERIITGAGWIADSDFTRDERKQRIFDECNNLRNALQSLLSEYESNAGKAEPSEALFGKLVGVGHKARDLGRHLRRAVVDHVSDAFLDSRVPLQQLVDAAQRGDRDGVEDAAVLFREHAAKLVDVASLCCSIAPSEEGARMVRYAALQVERLAPQVVNAARLLAARPDSRVAQDNMDAFRDAWLERVRLLTLAVDSVVSVDDFVAVSEDHINEDVRACIEAVVHKDGDRLDRAAGAIRGRSLRVCDVVEADMDLRPADAYTENVRKAVLVLRDNVVGEWSARAESAVNRLENGEDVEVDEVIDAATLVHNAIKDIRHALLMNREPGDIDSDEEYEEDEKTAQKPANDVENQRAVMRQLPEEHKKQIQQRIDAFKLVQAKFEREVAMWDEAGNDIVVLAKYMLMITLEMTDFTRGRGPLKTTMDVIAAAKKIADAGQRLNALSKQIAEQCVESQTKNDLLAYMERINTLGHQLKMTSKVKTNVQQVGDELVVTGLDSAMSLIQNARNLLNAVVLTVKAAYIASTKYPAKGAQTPALVVWNMRAPEKKALSEVRAEADAPAATAAADKPRHGIIRRASHRRDMQPIKALAQFNAA